MKQSKVFLASLAEAKQLSALKEDESSWLKMHNSLSSLTEHTQNKEECNLVLEKLKEFIIKTLLSDRSRLSGASIGLLNKIISILDDQFNESVFLNYLFKLVNKPNKVFNQRAEETLMNLNNKLLSKNFPLLKEQYNSVNKNVRRVVIRLLIKIDELLSQEMKALIEKAKSDNCGEVRKLAKDFSCVSVLTCSPLKKAVKKEESVNLFNNFKPIEKKIEVKKELNINELIFDFPKNDLRKEIIDKLSKKVPVKQRVTDLFKKSEVKEKSVDSFLEGINKLLKKEEKTNFSEKNENFYENLILQKNKIEEKNSNNFSNIFLGKDQISGLEKQEVIKERNEEEKNKIPEEKEIKEENFESLEEKNTIQNENKILEKQEELKNEIEEKIKVNENEIINTPEISVNKNDAPLIKEVEEFLFEDKKEFIPEDNKEFMKENKKEESFIEEVNEKSFDKEELEQEENVSNKEENVIDNEKPFDKEEVINNDCEVIPEVKNNLLDEIQSDEIKEEIYELVEIKNEQENNNLTDHTEKNESLIKENNNKVIEEIQQINKNENSSVSENKSIKKEESLDTEKIFTKEIRNISFISREEVEELSLILEEKMSVKEKMNENKEEIKENELKEDEINQECVNNSLEKEDLKNNECIFLEKEETSVLIEHNKSFNNPSLINEEGSFINLGNNSNETSSPE